MMKYFFIVGLLFPLSLIGQMIEGKVTNKSGEPLIGANVYWQDVTSGVSTDVDGSFQINKTSESQSILIISYLGYTSDTILVQDQDFLDIQLQEMESLSEVVVKGRKDGIVVSSIAGIKTEQITQTELKKAACCDLAGCFETQLTVKPQTTNVITNSKELRILGLSGVYNQVLIDGFPLIQGLTYTYGISSVPGTLVDNIYVAKGANSVIQGFESISGQINVQTKSPHDSEKLLLNGYVNSFGETQANVNYTHRAKKWSNLTALHMVQPSNRIDRDEDTFMDLPLLTRYMVVNKWKYGNTSEWGWNSQIGARILSERRIGGQTTFDRSIHIGSNEVYGQSVNILQPEFWSKTAYKFSDTHNFVFFASGSFQDQNSHFGAVQYDANQSNFYGNFQYEHNYGNHALKTGTSIRYLNIEEYISFGELPLDRTYDGSYEKLEIIPGVFAENTMTFLDGRMTWIAGMRADHHNTFGMMYSPRTLVKYDVTPHTIMRASIGSGWRTINLFSENINLLVSSRDVIIADDLKPERALNYGFNITQKFTFEEDFSGYISSDLYRTEFQNQIFPDYFSDPSKALINNFEGKSISNGFQIELSLNMWNSLALKTGYNYLDVYRMEGEERMQLPFNPRHKSMAALSYKPVNQNFGIDLNMHWYGAQRLPNTASNPSEFQRPDYSRSYTIFNTQFSYAFPKLEFYAGCENIFNFRQSRPIISWQDPFGPHFDTSSVWGSTRGREFYLGFRYRIDHDGE